MNTQFLLMAQYNGAVVIPLAVVCKDYFKHLTPEKFARKVSLGEIKLPMIRMEGSNKSARGIHIADLAAYLDERREAAIKELKQITE